MSKLKLATVWLGGCSGCHMSILDIDERILDVAKLADIVKSPIVDGKSLPEVDITLVEGAVSGDEHLKELLHIREKSKILVALGDCAVTGNITALRNFIPKDEVLERAYATAESNDSRVIPVPGDILGLTERVIPLHEAVKVDYFIPGCPPDADTIFYVLFELLNGRKPSLADERIIKYG